MKDRDNNKLPTIIFQLVVEMYLYSRSQYFLDDIPLTDIPCLLLITSYKSSPTNAYRSTKLAPWQHYQNLAPKQD